MEPTEQQNPLEQLGGRLRALRAQAAMTGKALADVTGWDQSKVSRIERGQILPSIPDVETWVRATGADASAAQELVRLREEARIWRSTFKARMSQGQTAVQKDYNQIVAESLLIRHLETAYVPGLLQTRAYAHRVLSEQVTLQNLAVDDVDKAVETRMQRQMYLYDPDKHFEFLLVEPVLRYLLPTPAVMREQLDRLQSVIGLERIRFGIIPMGVQLKTTPQNTIQVYVGPDQVRSVVETFAGEDWEPDHVEANQRAIDLMWEDAVEGERARELIIRAARDLPS